VEFCKGKKEILQNFKGDEEKFNIEYNQQSRKLRLLGRF